MLKNKRLIACVVLAGCMALLNVSCSNKKKDTKRGRNDNYKVQYYVVKPTELAKSITVSGTILPNEQVDLRNEVQGRVTSVNLQEGKFVKEGTLLLQLFDDDLRAQLSKIQAQLDILEKNYRRQTELRKIDGISQADYEQSSLQIASLKADIEVQKTLIRKMKILAPFDGIIGLKNVSTGAIIPQGTTVATIRDVHKLKLDFSVPEKYAPVIKPGLNVRFSKADDETEYTASVIATEGGIQTDTRNINVRALIQKEVGMLTPGGYVNVKLELANNPEAIQIPTSAIIPNDRTNSVIVARNGKAHFVEVNTGIRSVRDIEITSGLQVGDTVITTGILFLKEGDKLTYSKAL